MHTIPVNEEIYSGSGWAVAAILNGRVIAFQKIEHPDAGDVAAAVEALKATPEAAEGARLYREWMDADDEAEHIGSTFRIVGGMMSCGEFCYGLTNKERSQAGVKNKWF